MDVSDLLKKTVVDLAQTVFHLVSIKKPNVIKFSFFVIFFTYSDNEGNGTRLTSVLKKQQNKNNKLRFS